MTGGQMAPTTLCGQVTQTSPCGRDPYTQGFPLRMCEILSQVDGVSYIERCAIDTVQHINAAKKAIKKAFIYQREHGAYSFVELLCACPTNWGMTPAQAIERVGREMSEYFPLGVYIDKIGSCGR